MFLAPPGMTLPAFAPDAPLRIEYTVIDGQAILRRVPELLLPPESPGGSLPRTPVAERSPATAP